MADIATGKMIRESAKTVAVSNGNIVITKNDGSTVNNTSNSLTVTASTQSAITPSTQYAFTTEGGAGTIKIPNVSTGLGAGTYTLQNLLQQLVNRSHTHGTTSFTSGADTDTNSYCSYCSHCYYDNCSSSSCIIKGSVKTTNGNIEIENLKVGDFVLGIDNEYHEVVGIVKGTLENRKAIYFKEIDEAIFTEDHLFISSDGNYVTYNIDKCVEQTKKQLKYCNIYGTYLRSEEKDILKLENNLKIKLENQKLFTSCVLEHTAVASDSITYTPIVLSCEWIYVNGIPAACARKI
jgi:hypothetical protein